MYIYTIYIGEVVRIHNTTETQAIEVLLDTYILRTAPKEQLRRTHFIPVWNRCRIHRDQTWQR